ncbi:hypothetical protein GA0115253_1079715 [Streptomyces sp. Termitarium-T10T-6]|nr:hypothetical protein GA0115253_1079715 [Streptomyces sp. Termitarium-T10T-6]
MWTLKPRPRGYAVPERVGRQLGHAERHQAGYLLAVGRGSVASLPQTRRADTGRPRRAGRGGRGHDRLDPSRGDGRSSWTWPFSSMNCSTPRALCGSPWKRASCTRSWGTTRSCSSSFFTCGAAWICRSSPFRSCPGAHLGTPGSRGRSFCWRPRTTTDSPTSTASCAESCTTNPPTPARLCRGMGRARHLERLRPRQPHRPLSSPTVNRPGRRRSRGGSPSTRQLSLSSAPTTRTRPASRRTGGR